MLKLCSPVNISSITGTDFVTVLSSVTNIGLFSIPVFTSIATINFQSRSTAGLHFFATYVTAKQCPTGYLYNAATKQCQYVDVNKNKHQHMKHITNECQCMHAMLILLHYILIYYCYIFFCCRCLFMMKQFRM
jgi:hypothetical protein